MDLLIHVSEWGKRNNMKNKDFDLKNLPVECQDSSIKDSDFKLIDSSKIVHEQKFETKPTTFFKDSLKRFAKNKSSVVGAVIVGLLLVLSVLIPIFDSSNIKEDHPYEHYLQPKLFNAGSGFWDGTKKYTDIVVNTGVNGLKETDKENNWWPDANSFPQKSAILKKVFSEPTYIDSSSELGNEGYLEFVCSNTETEPYVELLTRPFATRSGLTLNSDFTLQPTDKIILKSFDVYNIEKIKELEGDKPEIVLPDGYEVAPVEFYFNYNISGDSTLYSKLLLSESETFDIGSEVTSRSKDSIDLAEIIRETGHTNFKNAYFSLRIQNKYNGKYRCSLLRSFEIDAQLADEEFASAMELINFSDASDQYNCPTHESASIRNRAYWATTGDRHIFLSKIVHCSFLLDTYEEKYGEIITDKLISESHCEKYDTDGTLKWKISKKYDKVSKEWYIDKDASQIEILDPEKCPIKEFLSISCDPLDPTKVFIKARISMWQYLGYKHMPRWIFGTDDFGRDMLKYVFEGLKYSLALGIMTFVICFLFGLLWGSVSGYFGGAVDLVMERFTDILSGVPWIVVMTLVIIRAQESSFGVFLLALCLTGWIGTASTARTQFYRFRGREYVLASRTLGASDARLIAKHILPNAMGTIITGAVLMIPSVIFSEATISYLGIGFTNLSSLGVILSHEQQHIQSHPHLLIFPSVIIALLMISFNLFGNGLRDAVNPSLKGEGE